jgi:hypothetical protein
MSTINTRDNDNESAWRSEASRRFGAIERIQEEQYKSWQQVMLQMGIITEQLRHVCSEVATSRETHDRTIIVESDVRDIRAQLVNIQDRSSKIFYMCTTVLLTGVGGIVFKVSEPHIAPAKTTPVEYVAPQTVANYGRSQAKFTTHWHG